MIDFFLINRGFVGSVFNFREFSRVNHLRRVSLHIVICTCIFAAGVTICWNTQHVVCTLKNRRPAQRIPLVFVATACLH